MQLAAFTPDHFPLGQTAVQINEGLPNYVVNAMERRYGPLTGRRIGLLGMAFKGESDDVRSSLSYKLRKLLAWRGAHVLCTDPYVRDERLVELDQVMQDAEVLVLGAPHRAYRELEVGGRDVVDVWGLTGGGIRL
jgi:UDP-N-acetyl-D-mannosaminuronic acid dehydrogenase